MSDNDLLCLDRYVEAIRAAVEDNRGGLEEITITWFKEVDMKEDGTTDWEYFPNLRIKFRPAPDAEPVDPPNTKQE